MIKALIGALMVIGVNAPMPILNESEGFAFELISANDTFYSATGDETDYFDYANFYRKNYQAENTDLSALACVYSQYTYTDSNPDYLTLVSKKTGINADIYGKYTPKALWYLKITNKKELDNVRLRLQWLLPSQNRVVNQHTVELKEEIYYTTNNSFDSYYMNVNNTNFNYIDNVKSEVESNIYTQKLTTITTQNLNTIDLTTQDYLKKDYGTYYIMIFLTLTTINMSNATMQEDTNNTNYFCDLRGDYIYTTPKVNPTTTVNYEVIDLPSLMFTILTMPFSFVSQAFNLTLFSGTPYMINLSQLFLALIGVLVFMFIIKIFLSNR